MDIIDLAINRRIMAGFFPTEKLTSTSIEASFDIDFSTEAAPGLDIFKREPQLLYRLFKCCIDRVKEIEKLNYQECYCQEVNILINAKCRGDYLRIDGSLQDAINLTPVVTPLDKVLWFGAFAYYHDIYITKTAPANDATTIMLALIHLLFLAQDMELNQGYTIKIDAVTPTTRIYDILNGANNRKSFHGCLRKLTLIERASLKSLSEKKRELHSKIQRERTEAKEIADKTEKEWGLFLRIINDISQKESAVVRKILDSASAREKTNAIHEYSVILDHMEKGRYTLDGESVDYYRTLYSVSERFMRAPFYCCAHNGDGKPFILHPALVSLAMDPVTFNYLLLSFHGFRINPTKETAMRFVSLSLKCIRRNLGGEDRNLISLNDMIEDFHSCVVSYMQEHESAIKQLSFQNLLPNAVVVDGVGYNALASSELLTQHLKGLITTYQNSDDYEKEVQKIVKGISSPQSLNELLSQKKEIESRFSEIDQESDARKIILSLNIIYLFCEALRIILSSKRGDIKIRDREIIETYRRDLQNLDDKLVHAVYSNMDRQKIGMLEYREKYGLYAFSLSEQETQEERFRNSEFAAVLKTRVEKLVEGIESANIDQVLNIGDKIRSEIFRFPDCDQKEQYGFWLDSISNRICTALISICRRQKDDYQSIKNNILNNLGPKSNLLPASALDALTTAEMLFSKYATEDYEKEGFDFSCISALYYQAVEDTYNKMIWHDYATMLNNLVLNGTKYTDILDRSRNGPIIDPVAKGYLDDTNAKQRQYYTERNYGQTTVRISCMYKSFAIMMEHITNPSTLIHFCEHFAKLSGFQGCVDMFRDQSFLHNCQRLAHDINSSTTNRNNASHGGSYISLVQCSMDKQTVVNNLEPVQDNCTGLIQQLLFLLK